MGGLNKKWKGTGRDYSKIIFSRRFHPPCHGETVLAEWDDNPDSMGIVIRMSALKREGYANNRTGPRMYAYLLNHETLHGVILGVQKKDKIPYEDIGESELVVSMIYPTDEDACVHKKKK